VTGGWLGIPDSNQESDMSDTVHIEGQSHDNAVLLLDAAQALELDPGVVKTSGDGFDVPTEVATKAGFDEDGQPKKAAAKKAAAPKAGE
jgi:hypothetical protein